MTILLNHDRCDAAPMGMDTHYKTSVVGVVVYYDEYLWYRRETGISLNKLNKQRITLCDPLSGIPHRDINRSFCARYLFIYYVIFTQEYPISVQHCSLWSLAIFFFFPLTLPPRITSFSIPWSSQSTHVNISWSYLGHPWFQCPSWFDDVSSTPLHCYISPSIIPLTKGGARWLSGLERWTGDRVVLVRIPRPVCTGNV